MYSDLITRMLALTVCGILMTIASGQAATVTFLGADFDTHDAWRSSSISKPSAFDPNGDNAYGNDGYRLYQDGGIVASVPSYLSSLTSSGSTYVNGAYADYDDPTLPIGSTVANVDAGLFYGAGIKISFTLNADVRIIVTLPSSGSSPPNTRPSDVSMQQTSGGGASASGNYSGGGDITTVEYLFFEVAGSAGDAFDVVLTATGSQGITGAAFELVPPPPPAGTVVSFR